MTKTERFSPWKEGLYPNIMKLFSACRRAPCGSPETMEPKSLHEAYTKLNALTDAPPDTDDALRDAFTAILKEIPKTVTVCVVTGVGESGLYTPGQFLSFVQGKRGTELRNLILAYQCELYMEANYGS
jgi:hypothetical protein